MVKNAFYFILVTFFVLKIFKLLFWLFGAVGKRLDKKVKVKFKIYDVANWETNDSHTARYLKK